jgi:hypothetical protein
MTETAMKITAVMRGQEAPCRYVRHAAVTRYANQCGIPAALPARVEASVT